MPPSVLQQAATAQLANPSWPAQGGLLKNLFDNMFQTWRRGRQMVAAQDAARDMGSADTQAALRRMQAFLQQGDFVKNPVDRVLFRPETLGRTL